MRGGCGVKIPRSSLSQAADERMTTKIDTLGDAVSITSSHALAQRRDPFFARTALVMLACVLLSFPLTYYWPVASATRAFAPLVHIHGAFFFAWMFLYARQTRLVATGRGALHREIGLAGIALSTVLVPLGIAAAIRAAEAREARGDPLPFATTLYNVVDIVLFAVLMVASIAAVTRHREWHRRFTYAAALCLVGPAISRWIVPYFSAPPVSDFAPNIVADLFLVALAVHDRRALGRIHPATIVATAIMVPIHLASPAISLGSGWNEVAPAILALSP